MWGFSFRKPIDLGLSEGGKCRIAALAMKRGKSVDFSGYWKQHIVD